LGLRPRGRLAGAFELDSGHALNITQVVIFDGNLTFWRSKTRRNRGKTLWGLLWVDCFKKAGNCGYYPQFSRDKNLL
jgi:hypothetical protein